MKSYAYLMVAIICEVLGTTALKESDGFSRLGPSIIVGLAYAASFYLLSLTLKTIPTAVGYAIWSGAGTALISLISWIYLGQVLDKAAIIGIFLIVSGVLVINIFSKIGVH